MSDAIAKCWELRGCAGIMGLTDPMEVECPHARDDYYAPCPAECKYAAGCSRPWRKVAHDFDLILDDTVDRRAAIKQQCYMCEHFLKHGPRLSETSDTRYVIPDTTTQEGGADVTLHIF